MQISPKLLNALYIGGLFKKTANGTLVRACTRKGALFAFLEGSQDQVFRSLFCNTPLWFLSCHIGMKKKSRFLAKERGGSYDIKCRFLTVNSELSESAIVLKSSPGSRRHLLTLKLLVVFALWRPGVGQIVGSNRMECFYDISEVCAHTRITWTSPFVHWIVQSS